MKYLHVVVLPLSLGWDARPWQGCSQKHATSTYMHTWGKIGLQNEKTMRQNGVNADIPNQNVRPCEGGFAVALSVISESACHLVSQEKCHCQIYPKCCCRFSINFCVTQFWNLHQIQPLERNNLSPDHSSMIPALENNSKKITANFKKMF